jgi:putative DNA primase/helicase
VTSPRNETLFDFDPEAVAAQIRNQAATVPVPAQVATERPMGEATANGLLPDTLTDRGNAKLFVKLYASDYRYVSRIGWFRWDTTRWQMDETKPSCGRPAT